MITRPYQITAALLTSLLLLTAPAASAQQSYWVLKAIPSLKPAGGAGSGPVAPKVELAAGLLPDGMEGEPYSFDLKTLTQVTAGPGIGSVQYALAGGTLPAGVSLSNDGVLAGTPTAKTTPEGAGFTVQGTYVTATGQQAYTIKVGESVLDVVQIAGGGSHTCAITTAGAAKCWGFNLFGLLGNGSTTDSTVPVQVIGLTAGVASIAVGGLHTCAVTTGGSAKCWGMGGNGQLGNGGTSDSLAPVDVTGLGSGVSIITVGAAQSCVVTTGGSAKCWGYNAAGQLGNGSTTDSKVPVQVVGLTAGVTSIATGNGYTCAVVSGSARCWGYNAVGQLGNGSTTDSKVPVQVVGLTAGVTSIAAREFHTCAVTTGGSAKCWGMGGVGQLGNGVSNDSNVPVQVIGLTAGVTSIAAGSAHTCAVVSGSAKCWGMGGFGQLGNGVSNDSNVPVQVVGLTAGVTSIAAGDGHTCAVVSGSAKCWGENGTGKLGNGSISNSIVPVNVKNGQPT